MWLRKAFAKVAPVLGKVKNAVDTGLKIYDKGRNIYTEAKSTVGGIPLVGNVAADLIKKQEDKANAYVKGKTGVNMSDVNKGVGIAREVSKILPPSM